MEWTDELFAAAIADVLEARAHGGESAWASDPSFVTELLNRYVELKHGT